MKYLVSLVISFLLLSNVSGQKTVLLEKFTNSHCGNCPNGALLLQDLVDTYPNAIWISHYKPWDMVLNNDQSDQLWFDLEVWGNPLLAVDRKYDSGLFHSMNSWILEVEEALSQPQVANVTVKNVFTNAFLRTGSFHCEVSWLEEQEVGDYRISAMLVEDLVTGEPQDNYYSDTPGHPLFGLGSEIWNYEHRNVVRHIFDDAWGTPELLASQPGPGDITYHRYDYTIPEDFNIENMSVVCAVNKYNPDDLSQIDVLQAAQMDLSEGEITSTDEILNLADFNIFPNPASTEINVSLTENSNEIKIVDAIGRVVFNEKGETLSSTIDVSELREGIYFVQLRNNEKLVTKPLSILRD